MTERVNEGVEGFWSPHTATIDWCESNYTVTHYIAEFWNTVSNLVMILFPLYGVYWSWRHTTHARLHSKLHSKRPPLFSVASTIVWCHVGLVLVGVGSWCFHMTLLYPAQLLDELPMLFGSAFLIYGNYDILLASYELENGRNWRARTVLGKFLKSKLKVFGLIVTYCLSVTYVYLFVWKNPIFHEMAYGLMNVTLIYRYKLNKRLYLVSFVYYMFGFALWNVDNKFCPWLHKYRAQIEYYTGTADRNENSTYSDNDHEWKRMVLNSVAVSLKALSEFHAWWHVFTGYAAFMTILFLTDVHYKHYLLVNCKTNDVDNHPRPVESKLCNMFYYLGGNLLTLTNEIATNTNGNQFVNKKNKTTKKLT